MDALKNRIRNVPDFPKAGILFYDVTTLLRDPQGFRLAIDGITAPFTGSGIDLVVGIESRGFILGGAVAKFLAAGARRLDGIGHGLGNCHRIELVVRKEGPRRVAGALMLYLIIVIEYIKYRRLSTAEMGDDRLTA